MKDIKLVQLLNKVVNSNTKYNKKYNAGLETYTYFNRDVLTVNASFVCDTTLLMSLIQDQAWRLECNGRRCKNIDNIISYIINHKDFQVDRVNIEDYTALHYALQYLDITLSKKLVNIYIKRGIIVFKYFKDSLLRSHIYNISSSVNLYNKVASLQTKNNPSDYYLCSA